MEAAFVECPREGRREGDAGKMERKCSAGSQEIVDLFISQSGRRRGKRSVGIASLNKDVQMHPHSTLGPGEMRGAWLGLEPQSLWGLLQSRGRSAGDR